MSKITSFKDEETDDVLIPVDKNTGQWREDVVICKMIEHKVKKFRRRKDGTVYSLDRKYDYTTISIGTVDNQMFGGMDITVEKVKNNKTGIKETKLVLIDEKNCKKIDARLSKVGVHDLIKYLVRAYNDDVNFEFDIDPKHTIDMSTDTLVYIALLKSPTYTIIKKDVVSLGGNPNTVPKILKSMVNKGVLVEVGMVGNSIVYKCTIPRDELLNLFKPTSKMVDTPSIEPQAGK